MTKHEALSLTHNQTIYHKAARNSDKSALRACTTGKPIQGRSGVWWVPLKHGLRTTFNLNDTNVSDWLLHDPTAAGR